MAIPDAELLAEFDTDPVTMGYKDAPVEPDGYKDTRTLGWLISSIRQIPNPDAADPVPKDLNADDLYNLIPMPERVQIITANGGTNNDGWWWAEFERMCAANDKLGLTRLVTTGFGALYYIRDTSDALIAEINATVDDPNYPPTIDDPDTPRITVLWGETTVNYEQIDRVLGRS